MGMTITESPAASRKVTKVMIAWGSLRDSDWGAYRIGNPSESAKDWTDIAILTV